jgi:hypothetical protein
MARMRIRFGTETLVERADVDAILRALFDIRVELGRIRSLLQGDDGEQRDEEQNS